MRVVSLVPSLTEALADMGLALGDEIVGVTSFCVHPADARRRARVIGGTKNPNVDRIIALAPDLVVVNFEENRRVDVDAITAAGVPVHVTEIRTVADAERALRALGAEVGHPEEGDAMADEIATARADLEKTIAGRGEPVPVFVPIWKEPWMGFNRDTFAHDVLTLAGARNVLADADARYPVTTIAEVLEAGARVALLPSEPWRFEAPDVAALKETGFADAALLDGEALTWYGSRTPWGIREVARVVAEAAKGAGGARASMT